MSEDTYLARRRKLWEAVVAEEARQKEQWAKTTTDTLDHLRGVGNVVCTIEEWNALHAELAAARTKIAALEARG